jgi:hypothetical protein
MTLRALLISLILLVLAAPGAGAASIASRILPIRGAADGVTAGTTNRTAWLKFGPRAATLYRKLAGQKATVGCGDLSVKDDGEAWSGATVGSDGSSRSESGRAGLWWVQRKLPGRRGRVSFLRGQNTDVCFIATREPKSDDICVEVVPEDGLCVRVLVALTDKGRTALDERSRSFELDTVFSVPIADIQKEFGADSVVALASPDASPPVDQVGVFQSGQTTAAVATLADGRRWYVRQDGDVFSTNVPGFSATPHRASLII